MLQKKTPWRCFRISSGCFLHIVGIAFARPRYRVVAERRKKRHRPVGPSLQGLPLEKKGHTHTHYTQTNGSHLINGSRKKKREKALGLRVPEKSKELALETFGCTFGWLCLKRSIAG